MNVDEGRPESSPSSSRRSVGRVVLVTALVSGAAILAAAVIDRSAGTGSAVAVLMLGVVIASILGGIPAGLATAGIASLALASFFSAPVGVPGAGRTADLIATLVFLAIAIIVGLLVAGAVHERAVASRREHEAQFLRSLANRFLSGDVPERALDEFVRALLDPLSLVGCRIAALLDGVELRAEATDPARGLPGSSVGVELAVGDTTFGTLTAIRPAGARPMSRSERLLLESAARQASAALERARLDAQVRHAQLDAETNQLRAAMFSSVTHDLRTPLASIMAGVTSLLDETAVHDHEQQRELLVTIREETDRLNRLVGNIMDLAKIRAGALISAREPTAMDEIVVAVLQRLRARLSVSMRATLAADLPDVLADPVQMDQVLSNLVENAARHAPANSEIDVDVRTDGDRLRTTVRDRGPGIPPDDRERVFEAFYRGSRGPEQPGSGLGLAIVRAIVSAHEGAVWIEEPPEGGTAVVFDLPIETAPKEMVGR